MISRRTFLRGLAVVPGVLLLEPGQASAVRTGSRALAFEHAHTGEKLSLVYWADGRYLPDALVRIDRFMRDHRTGQIHPIDPKLLDLLHEVQRRTGNRAPFEMISGYRSAATNERLRAQGHRVAKRSLHMVGKAIDLRLPDLNTRRLRDAAVAMRRGGVGYYARSNFVHLDTGRVRKW